MMSTPSTTMPAETDSLKAWDTWLSEQLAPVVHNDTQRRLEVGLLLEALFGISSTDRLAYADRCVQWQKDLAWLQDALDKRLNQRMPIQYLLGKTFFMGLPLSIQPGVFIPRPETELLVEAALHWLDSYTAKKPFTLVDCCCGSGAIALALAYHQPDARVIGMDRSEEALNACKTNGQQLNLTVDWRQGEWFGPLNSELVDLIVCNPPYIPPTDHPTLSPEVLNEPHLALFCPQDDVISFYVTLIQSALRHLKPGGAIMMELGEHQALNLSRNETIQAFSPQFIKDYAGIDRHILITT